MMAEVVVISFLSQELCLKLTGRTPASTDIIKNIKDDCTLLSWLFNSETSCFHYIKLGSQLYQWSKILLTLQDTEACCSRYFKCRTPCEKSLLEVPWFIVNDCLVLPIDPKHCIRFDFEFRQFLKWRKRWRKALPYNYADQNVNEHYVILAYPTIQCHSVRSTSSWERFNAKIMNRK